MEKIKSNKDIINNLPLEDILNKLGYHEGTHYKRIANNLRMFDDSGKMSDGWIGDINKNKMFCRSGVKAGRFEGDIIGIIKGALKLEVADAISWAEENFNLDKNKIIKNGLKEKWDSLSALKEPQIKYLTDRGIEYNKNLKSIIKAEGSLLVSRIQTSGLSIKALQKRESKNVDKKYRFRIEKDKDNDGDGIFINIPNKEEKIIYIVEGLTDFWTLAQFGVNVIGLVSGLVGISFLKDFHKSYELIYISDNDETGEKSYKKLLDEGIKFHHYKIDIEDINDINDFRIYSSKMGLSGKEFLEEIYDNADRPLTNIQKAIMKAIENRTMGRRKIGDSVFDQATGGIIPGSLMIINGFTGEGKTTTLDWISKKLTEVHNRKVAYCSMDDDTGKMLAMFLGRKFNKDWNSEVYPNIEKYVKEYGEDKFNNFLFYDDIRTIDDFTELVEEEKIDVLIIDYIQIIQGLPGKDKKNQMIYASEQLQIIAKKYRCAVICLSQASMGEVNKPVIQRNPNESFMIRATADTFINVGVYEGKHKIGFVKNKYGSTKYKFTEHDTTWNEKTGDISIFQDFNTLDNNVI